MAGGGAVELIMAGVVFATVATPWSVTVPPVPVATPAPSAAAPVPAPVPAPAPAPGTKAVRSPNFFASC